MTTTLEPWALLTVTQMRTDIGPGASGWDRSKEGTDLENIINDAILTVGVPKALRTDVRNLIVARLLKEERPRAEGTARSETVTGLERRINAGQLNSSLIAVESFLKSSPEVEKWEEEEENQK